MAIKSRESTQFYIQQFVLTNEDNPEYWEENKFEDIIIGYIFSVKEGKSFVIPTRTLNIYFISKDAYTAGAVSMTELREVWQVFSSKCITTNDSKKSTMFKNPPLHDWMNTKENWCKKLAKKLSLQFNKSLDDMLSEVNFSIVRLYNKGFIYMGNLNYVQIAIYNYIRMNIRFYKKRLVSDNNNILSLDDILTTDEDGNLICLGDTVGNEDPYYNKLEETEAVDKALSLLKASFSDREIEQILNQKAGYLPRNLYRRVLVWRQKHKKGECYE